MIDPTLERQFLPELALPERGDRALVWRHGVVLEVTVTGMREVFRSQLREVAFVLDGSLSTAPADRVTRLSRQ